MSTSFVDSDGTTRFRGDLVPPSAAGVPVVYGPYPVTFANFSGGDGSTFNIATFPDGSLLTNWWADPGDSIEWQSATNAGDGFMGQGAGWTVGTNGQFGEPFATGRGPGFVILDGLSYFGQRKAGNCYWSDGTLLTYWYDFPFPLDGGLPIQGKWVGGGDPAPTAGRTVLYFEVLTPPFAATA